MTHRSRITEDNLTPELKAARDAELAAVVQTESRQTRDRG